MSSPADARPRAVPAPVRGVVAVVIRDAFDASVQRLLVADPIARVGTDPEGVHQARVATRRLRSDLHTFMPLLDEEWAAALRDELRWLGSELGVAREAEVLLGHLRNRARALPPDIACAVTPVVDAARGDHEAAHARVLAALQSARYLDLVDRLVQAAMAPRLLPSAASATTGDLARIARQPWKKLARAYSKLGPAPADPVLHALRIRAKRARYAVEAVAGAVGGEPARAFAARLTDLQTVLGDHQDAVVAQDWLADHATGSTAYATGMLAGLLRADALAATAALPHVWHRASRPRLRAWM